jgi:5-methylcytosine-specific restriction endonuclease McrA
LVDEFAQFERRSEILADFTTRELVTELSDRLERRGNVVSKKTYKCVYCGKKYDTAAKVCRLFQPGFSAIAEH